MKRKGTGCNIDFVEGMIAHGISCVGISVSQPSGSSDLNVRCRVRVLLPAVFVAEANLVLIVAELFFLV